MDLSITRAQQLPGFIFKFVDRIIRWLKSFPGAKKKLKMLEVFSIKICIIVNSIGFNFNHL